MQEITAQTGCIWRSPAKAMVYWFLIHVPDFGRCLCISCILFHHIRYDIHDFDRRLFHRRSIWRYDKLSSSTSSARQFDFALGIQIRFSLKLVSWLREPASHLFAWDYYCSVIAMNRTDGANIGCLIIFSHLWANAWSMQTPKTLLNWILRNSTNVFSPPKVSHDMVLALFPVAEISPGHEGCTRPLFAWWPVFIQGRSKQSVLGLIIVLAKLWRSEFPLTLACIPPQIRKELLQSDKHTRAVCRSCLTLLLG